MSNYGAHMSNSATGSIAERRLMTTVAKRFYIEDVPKTDIAKELGLSRFKIARLLEMAKRTGVVKISIDEGTFIDNALSELICEHLGLANAVVTHSQGNAHEVRKQVGTAAADYLAETLTPGDVVGLAWGRTLTAMTKELRELPKISVVQLTGALGGDIASSPVDVVRRVSDLAGGQAHVIFAPMVVDTAEAAIALRRQTEVATAMELFDSTTVAVVSVGSWDPPNSQLLDALSPEDRADLIALGVQAEIAGILVTADGTLVHADFAERCVSITAQQMYAIPSVIAVAGGRDKARAMYAVIRAGLVSSVVIDRDLAEGILSLPAVQQRGPMTNG